jgi:hypothetical protein
MDCISRVACALHNFKSDKSYLEVLGAIQICYLLQDSMKFLSHMFNIKYQHNGLFRDFCNSLSHSIDRNANKSFSLNLLIGCLSTYNRNKKEDFVEVKNIDIVLSTLLILF